MTWAVRLALEVDRLTPVRTCDGWRITPSISNTFRRSSSRVVEFDRSSSVVLGLRKISSGSSDRTLFLLEPLDNRP